MLSQLTPSPDPTVTVTETVVVTPPVPAVNIQVPPDGWDWWHDVVWGDFGGAAFGIIGALAAAVIGSWLVNRGARLARQEEHRQLVAQEYADVARQLSKELTPTALVEDRWAHTLDRFETLSGRIVRQYSKDPDHKKFAMWIMVKAQPIGLRLEPIRLAFRDMEAIQKDLNSLREMLHELSADLLVIEHTTLEWMMRKPADWEPDTSAREALERVKKLLANSTSHEVRTPD